MGKTRGMGAGRKLRKHRREERWADKQYKKSHLGNEWKKPFAGSPHAKGIVLEKIGIEANQPNRPTSPIVQLCYTQSHMKSLRSIMLSKQAVSTVDQRTFSAGASKAKKGKGGVASDAPKTSSLSKEVKSTTVVGANILKDGTDPKVLPDSEYPDWLWHLIDKKPALSELRRKDTETLPYEDLKRFVKLDARARIKENNSIKAKN